jgi:hypothetical protein
VQEVQAAVKDAAQEAQEAYQEQVVRVNCEEANVSQKLDVEKKVKMKMRMKKKKFC